MKKEKNIIEYFECISDPRLPKKSKHKVIDIIVLSVCALISNCETFVHIEQYGKSKIDWLKRFLDLPNGIPSHDTIGRVFGLIDPVELQKAFQEWAESVMSKLNLKENIINIDGKYLYSSKGAIDVGETGRKTFFGMINAFSTTAGIAIAQLRTDFAKKNEVEATRDLIKRLNLTACTVTLDAMSSQPETTVDIKGQGGDYLIALKKNQRKLYAKSEVLLDIVSTQKNSFEVREKGHGREEIRKCTVKKLSKKFLSELNDYYQKLKRPTWDGLNCILKIESTRIVRKKERKEVRYYLTSRPADAKKLLTLARSHWAVENKLHYALDVSFDEDHSRVRNGFAGENLAVMRQLSLNLLKKEKTFKGSIKSKRLECGWNNDYLEKIIIGISPQDYVI